MTNWEVLTGKKIIVIGVRMTEILDWQVLGELKREDFGGMTNERSGE